MDRFEARIRAELDARGLEYVLHDGWVFLGDPADDHSPRMGLTSLGQRCVQVPETEWAGFMREHFDRTLASMEGLE